MPEEPKHAQQLQNVKNLIKDSIHHALAWEEEGPGCSVDDCPVVLTPRGGGRVMDSEQNRRGVRVLLQVQPT